MTFFVCSRWVRENGKRPDEPESDELLGGTGLCGRENLRVKGRVIADDGRCQQKLKLADGASDLGAWDW